LNIYIDPNHVLIIEAHLPWLKHEGRLAERKRFENIGPSAPPTESEQKPESDIESIDRGQIKDNVSTDKADKTPQESQPLESSGQVPPANRYRRTIGLPANANRDAIIASYEHGLLWLKIGKKELPQERVKINLE